MSCHEASCATSRVAEPLINEPPGDQKTHNRFAGARVERDEHIVLVSFGMPFSQSFILAPPADALNPDEYKIWRDTIFPHGGPDNYIDHLCQRNIVNQKA